MFYYLKLFEWIYAYKLELIASWTKITENKVQGEPPRLYRESY
jgi:hypothetical protein